MEKIPNLGGFSWRRLLGISKVKGKVGRWTGIPMIRSGRQRKIGGLCCGHLVPIFLLVIARVAMVLVR